MATDGKSRRIGALVIVFLALMMVAQYVVWSRLLRDEPLVYESDVDHFKYGSIGTEKEGLQVPYWVWLVLPRIFPEYLPGPGGYASLGFAWEEGNDLPIGLTKKVIGQPRVGINCAMCHTATVRGNRFDKPAVYVGAPAHQLDAQGYFRFLFACASDPRFTADRILTELAPSVDLGFVDKLIYRYILIPQAKKGLLELEESMAWMDRKPRWGRGRVDPVNPAKFSFLGIPVDQTIGNSDTEPVWNMRARVDNQYRYYWDGLLHGPLRETVLSSALAASTTPRTLPLEDLKRMEDWLLDAPVPRYPFPVDQALASQGGTVFRQHCADCHAVGGKRTGKVIPIAEVGTDRHRLDSWTRQAADNFNALGKDQPWEFTHFEKTDGYTAVLLDGVWLRGPYLHNGSAATLVDLLEPVANRPKKFYRGYDLYDQEKVGFITQGPDAARVGFLQDAAVPGNANTGHLWGTTLPPDQKRALVEYMKTL